MPFIVLIVMKSQLFSGIMERFSVSDFIQIRQEIQKLWALHVQPNMQYEWHCTEFQANSLLVHPPPPVLLSKECLIPLLFSGRNERIVELKGRDHGQGKGNLLKHWSNDFIVHSPKWYYTDLANYLQYTVFTTATTYVWHASCGTSCSTH